MLVTLLGAGTAALGQVYRWVDERGVVHYGERPPSGAVSRQVEGKRTAPPAAAPTGRADFAQQEREFQQRRIEREQRENEDRQQAADTRVRCERERLRLATLREAWRIVTGVNEKGEWQYLEDAERADAIRRQETAVAQRCG